MKPTLRKATPHLGCSFTIRKDVGDAMINNWHYHPEFELLYIKKSLGNWLIGDHIGYFESGSIVLLGSNLPHCYKHDPEFLVNNANNAGESIGIYFPKDVFGAGFFTIPESEPIKFLLEKSQKGLKIIGESQVKCTEILEKMLDMRPTARMIELFHLLYTIAESNNFVELSSGVFTSLIDDDQEKIKCIFDYTMSHFDDKITVDDIASMIHMTKYSFCRFFKRKTKKTYLQFLLEIRIGSACKLLVEDEKNVAEVCYESGFNNLSHFHIQFKQITKMTPLEYKNKYLNNKGF